MSANERSDCYFSEMTIRERIAAMAMQGLVGAPGIHKVEDRAKLAVSCADALLAELAKPQEPTP